MRRVTATRGGRDRRLDAHWSSPGAVTAETYELKLVRLEPLPATGVRTTPRTEWLYRSTASQSIFRAIRRQAGGRSDGRVPKLVKKEPEKYQSQEPFRGVVKLGSQKFLFVLDAKDDSGQGLQPPVLRSERQRRPDRRAASGRGFAEPARRHLACRRLCQLPVPACGPDDGRGGAEDRVRVLAQRVFSRRHRLPLRLGLAERGRVPRRRDHARRQAPHGRAARLQQQRPVRRRSHDLGQPRGSDGQLYPQYGDMLLVDPDKAFRPRFAATT